MSAFGKGYQLDMSNDQDWDHYETLHPHYVLTLEDTLCQGGHFYSSQTFIKTGLTIFHIIVAADYLTKKPDAKSQTDFHIILEYTRKKIILFEPEYLALLQKAESQKTKSRSHVIPHVPNFSILEDIVGFFMLHNIALLGPVHTLNMKQQLKTLQKPFLLAKADALDIAKWHSKSPTILVYQLAYTTKLLMLAMGICIAYYCHKKHQKPQQLSQQLLTDDMLIPINDNY
ncbi:hypothetical protein F5876DRAFT_70792 [Lentinula aff. lateritia]|uniref:Uncharacterized protein n=1 Tax=Lentinula aff. lateritia TaxID=2804960 RepID=A0ACC1THW3_9AGAR|nr:hypothetical protein F5876DRAFT_70792 [Lentinula aff. lateritia]